MGGSLPSKFCSLPRSLFVAGGEHLLVRLCRISENGVSANVRARQNAKHDVPRWLPLIAHILMPERTRHLLPQKRLDFRLVVITMDDVEPRMPLDTPRHGLDVGFAKVRHKILLVSGPALQKLELVSEDDDLTLGDQERKLVFCSVGKVSEAETCDNGTHFGGDVAGFDSSVEQIGHILRSAGGGVDVVELGSFIVKGLVVPRREVFGELSAGFGGALADGFVREIDVVADGLFGLLGGLGV